VPPACVTTCFTIARPVGAEEALEEPPELRLFDANPVVRTAQDDRIADTLDRKRERRAGPRVADRVLGEVLGNDADHPRPDRELDARLALDRDRDPRPARALLELGGDRVQLGPHGDRAERDDTRAGLELAEEHDLVDQLADLVDLRPRALDELSDVLAGQRRRFEE
jgi:hypothetical protein